MLSCTLRFHKIRFDICTSAVEFFVGIIGKSRIFTQFCDLVVRVLGYRSGSPGSIPELPEKKVVGLERGQLSFVSTTEELLDRKVAAPV
jgi:hypothetical protein